MKNKRFQYVNCYYCGRLTRLDKAVELTITPRLKPDVQGSEPMLIQTAPIKIYICPACARYRGISRRDLKNKSEIEILRKLNIEI